MDTTSILKVTGLKTASDYQVAIFKFLHDQFVAYRKGQSTRSLLVSAVAGSGKTTTVVAAANLIPPGLNAIFLAFNKSIATELNDRLPDTVAAKTLNGLGFGVWARYARSLGIQKVNLDARKTNRLMRDLMSKAQIKDYGDNVRFLVGMCKSLGVTPEGMSDVEPVNGQYATEEVLRGIEAHFRNFTPAENRATVYGLVRTILARGLDQEGTLDFDDQKYMTVVKRVNGRSLPTNKYDVIFIDEVQDVNAVDMALIKLISKPNAVVIGVGDSRQAIYGFRGADTEAVNQFKAEFNADQLPLAITYRCGSALVSHAQELVPEIEAAPTAKIGEVVHLDKFSTADFRPGEDMVVCRNNAPLVNFAYTLIRAKVPVFVKGRDIGANLISRIEGLMEGTTSNEVSDLLERLDTWANKQIALIRRENDGEPDPEQEQRVADVYDTIKVFVENAVDAKVSTVVANIRSLFDDPEGKVRDRVVLSTVHKAKGLESDRVFMLNYNLFYPAWLSRGSWQYEQEQNCDYVARTRGKVFYGYIQAETVV